MRIVYCTASSLDGFIADERDDLGWLFATQNHAADPQGRYGDDDSLDFTRFTRSAGAVVLGSTSYAWLEREMTKDGEPFTWPYVQPAFLLTSRDVTPVPGVEVFSGDVAELHPRLVEAAGEKDVWILGGGDVAGQFADRGLLDVVWVHVCPVVLGSGKPLLPRRLRLHREALERDGQLTAMLFRVVGPEP